MDSAEKYIKGKQVFCSVQEDTGKKIVRGIDLISALDHNFAHYYSSFIGKSNREKALLKIKNKVFWSIFDLREKYGSLRYNKKMNLKEYDFLFFVNDVTHAKIATTVIAHESMKNGLIIVNGYRSKKFLRENNIPFFPLDQFSATRKKITLEKNNEQAELLEHLLNRTVGIVEAMANCLDAIKPKKVILFNEVDAFGKTLVRLAHNKDIETIYLQHGIILDHPSYQKMESKRILLWGKSAKDYFISRGNNEQGIILTGNPLLDKLKSLPTRKEGRKKVVCCYASQPPEFELTKEMNKIIFNKLLEINEKDFTLIIKLHPSEYIFNNAFPIFKFIYEKLKGKDIKVTKKNNMLQLIKNSDVLVTQFSTVGLEAIMAGKPVISINLTGNDNIAPFIKHGAAYEITNPEEIKNLVSICNQKETWENINKNREKIVELFNFKNDGKAAERIRSATLENESKSITTPSTINNKNAAS